MQQIYDDTIPDKQILHHITKGRICDSWTEKFFVLPNMRQVDLR